MRVHGFASMSDDERQAWDRHLTIDWGATAFGSVHTKSSGAEYKRAWLAGYRAANESN